MKAATEPYSAQAARWPASGRHVLAHYTQDAVVVYQAFRPAIGHFAARHKYFGGEFSLSRMSWIKPNFLWMVYRSGWGTKPDQEVTLAVWLQRAAFDEILRQAVPSTFVQSASYPDITSWKRDVSRSSVRLQWDPDHGPSGAPLRRRAIQLGLRGEVLARYARDWLLDIEDISEFVAQQRAVLESDDVPRLLTPSEHVYPVSDPAVAERLGLARQDAPAQ